ncbi:MAG TPA: hypothetical protein VNJ04_04915 [Gemmatimonadaceae bacterium]|nr:hypothetical protein [Gemmatimonadaceae bacterium]
MTDRAVLFAIVDRMGAKVTWLALECGRWKCNVTGVALTPHQGIGTTPLRALADVLVMAGSLGWSR